MVSTVSVSNNPYQTISSIFSAPHLIDILKMKRHANPEHHHLPRGKLSQVNTTSFKTVGFDIDSCYHFKYKLLVIVGVSVIRKIFREAVVKTIKYINSNGWFRHTNVFPPERRTVCVQKYPLCANKRLI